MQTYVEFEILEGAYEISCPDAMCPHQGILNIGEDIAALVSSDLVVKHERFRLNRGKLLTFTRTLSEMSEIIVNLSHIVIVYENKF